jgi:hypothetical protein
MKRQDITLTLLMDTIYTLPNTQRKRLNTMRRNMAIRSSRQEVALRSIASHRSQISLLLLLPERHDLHSEANASRAN